MLTLIESSFDYSLCSLSRGVLPAVKHLGSFSIPTTIPSKSIVSGIMKNIWRFIIRLNKNHYSKYLRLLNNSLHYLRINIG
ncbi:MAG: hypothetical protein HN417_12080 [Desulfobacula sp.]|nr:hypothetical protein [Desulfobacula sp.]